MIYLDIDGVLADLEQWVYKVDSTFKKEDWFDSSRVDKVFKENVNTVFLDSPRTRYFDYLKSVYDTNDCKLLTSAGNWWTDEEFEIVSNNKIKWCMSNGFDANDVIIVKAADEKLAYCNEGDVIYDDRRKTIENWNKKGGCGIYILNPARPW